MQLDQTAPPWAAPAARERERLCGGLPWEGPVGRGELRGFVVGFCRRENRTGQIPAKCRRVFSWRDQVGVLDGRLDLTIWVDQVRAMVVDLEDLGRYSAYRQNNFARNFTAPYYKSASFQILKPSNLKVFMSLNIQVFKYTSLQVYKSLSLQVFKCTNLQVLKLTNFQVYKPSSPQVFKS